MRLLFLCLLLLLPAATAVSKEDKEEKEGSADDGDDEDSYESVNTRDNTLDPHSVVDKATGVEETMDKRNQLTLIVIVVAVTVLTLSVATVVSIMLVRRRMHSRQQGIYSVPTEQDQKVSV